MGASRPPDGLRLKEFGNPCGVTVGRCTVVGCDRSKVNHHVPGGTCTCGGTTCKAGQNCVGGACM